MDKNYLDIVSRNILNEVKNAIRRNYIILEEEQEEKTDKKMLEIIKNIIENDYKINDKKEDEFEKDEENTKLNSYVMCSLIQYYMAIYNDNVNLLKKLLENNFNWKYNENTYEMNLFVLDKNLTSNFENEEELMKYLRNNIELFKNLYISLYRNRENEKIEPLEIIEKACNIIKQNKNIAQTNKSFSSRTDRLFTVDLLNNFTEEEILNLNEDQRKILENFNLEEMSLKYNLIKKYNYSSELIFWNEYEEYFTEEEIANLTKEDIDLYNKIFHSKFNFSDKFIPNAIEKLKEIKKKDPNFNNKLTAIVYDILTPEQIISLSPEVSEKIENLCFGFRRYLNITEKQFRRIIKYEKTKDAIKNKIKGQKKITK